MIKKISKSGLEILRKERKLESAIKCPECGFEKKEVLFTDFCQFFSTCTNCGVRLKLKEGDCCSSCPYKTAVRSPKQSNENRHL